MNRITSLMLYSVFVCNFHDSVLIRCLILCFVPCKRPQKPQSIVFGWNFHNSVNELIHFLILCCFVPGRRPQQPQSIAKFLNHLLSPDCHESSLACILLGGNLNFTRFQLALLGTYHCHLRHSLSNIQIEVLPIQNSLPSKR